MSDVPTPVSTPLASDPESRAAKGSAPLSEDPAMLRAEVARLHQELEASQRLESVGLLVGGIAHDFNNLLTAIQGYAGLLVHALEGDERQKMACEIKKVGEQATALTRQLLVASRRQQKDPECLDLSSLVEDSAMLLRRVLGETVRLELDLASTPTGVRANGGQLQQVILNLAINGRDAMAGKGGRLLLATRHLIEDGASWAVLIVEDTGSGMEPEVVERIFDPFFTTKAPDEGTGLGLSTVRTLVRRHGGRIDVESRLGEGTRFRILLPAVSLEGESSAKSDTARSAAASDEPSLGGEETILVVEDEDVVRLLASDFLRHLGYEVLEATDGAEAREILRGPGGPRIDLVLSDVVMPNLGGPELARRTAPERPDLRWVFMSGYPGQERLPRLPQGDPPFLEKPFKPTELGAMVRAALDSDSPAARDRPQKRQVASTPQRRGSAAMPRLTPKALAKNPDSR